MSHSDGSCVHGVPLAEGCVLCFDQREKAKRDVRLRTTFDRDVEIFVDEMILVGEWLTADLVIRRIGRMISATFKSDAGARTYFRHLAKASRGRIISGQRGYMATAKATQKEVFEAAAGLMTAAKGCIDRRSDILFVYHHGRSPTEQERKVYDGGKETKAATS
jgi:hypothetical protein